MNKILEMLHLKKSDEELRMEKQKKKILRRAFDEPAVSGLNDEETEEYWKMLEKCRQWIDEKKLTLEDVKQMFDEDLFFDLPEEMR